MQIILGFGLNEDGQCGVRRTGSICPISVLQFPDRIIVTTISAGSRHSLALSSTGMVYSWGWGLLGQLGLGNTTSVDTPSLVESLAMHKCTTIAAGGMHSAAIDATGSLYSWGSNGYGQLGLKPTSPDDWDLSRKIPCLVTDFSKTPVTFAKVACGGMHTAAIDNLGNVYCWGRADSGQTGISDWYLEKFSFPGIPYPVLLQGLDGPAIDVACGGFYTLILTASGCVYSMGKDDFGLLGIPAKVTSTMTSTTSKPTIIEYFVKNKIAVTSIAAGGWHSCFVSSTGDLYTCGKGEYGRLGLGHGVSQDEPVKVCQSVKSVSAGGSHTVWLSDDGEVSVVGRTCDGRLGLSSLGPNELKTGVTLPRQLNLKSYLPASPRAHIADVKCGGSHTFILVDADEMLVSTEKRRKMNDN
jgi:alpha-tubulin suppressor-like RCC1 family protein